MTTELNKSWKLVICIGLAVLLLGWFWSFVKVTLAGGGPRPTTMVLSDVKQQALALAMYSQDWDDRLPSAARWMDAAEECFRRNASHYRVENEEFVDPTLEYRNENEFGYAFFGPLSQLNRGLIKDPVTMPLTFQSKDLSRNANGLLDLLPYRIETKRGNVVSFVDGHAKFMPESWRFETIVIDLSQPEEPVSE